MRALYTIENETAQVRYAGNGVTKVFPVTFQFFEASTLRVRLVTGDTATVQALGSDYTVTGGAGKTGSVSTTVAVPTGSTLIVDLDIPATQETIDLAPNGPLPAEDVEQGFDRIVTMVKQIRQDVAQVPQMVPSFDPGALPVPVLPRPAASNLLIGRGDETGWQNVTLAAIAAAVAAYSPVPIPGQIVIQGTGDAAADTTMWTNAIATASATGLEILHVGTSVFRIPQTVAYTAYGHDVHVCVPLASNIVARGGTIKVETPQWAMPSDDRVMLFGTPTHTTTAGQMSNIRFEQMTFDFNETYGSIPSATYAFGVVGVDNFHRANIKMVSSPSVRRGRGLFAHNCRNRSSFAMRYHYIVQGYFTAYEDGVSELDLYGEGLTEFYDADGIIKNFVIMGVRVKNLQNEAQVFDLASAQNGVMSGMHIQNAAGLIYIYTKPQSAWATYAEFCKHSLNFAPNVTIDISTGFVTWPSDYDLVANGKVMLSTTGALPTGLNTTAMYYIVGSSIVGLSAQLSATPGGAAISLSGTQSGVHSATRYPYTPEGSNDVSISNVRGVDLKSTGDATILISNSRSNATRENTPVQCQRITLRDVHLAKGNYVAINEGLDLVIDDMSLTGFVPGSSAAFFAAQSLSSTPRIAESALTMDINKLSVVDSQGIGVWVRAASVLRARAVSVNGYNLQNDSGTAYGFIVDNLGRKSGSIDIDGVNIYTTIANCTDFYLDEINSGVQEYLFRIGEDLRLRTVASGFINLRCDVASMLDGRRTLNIPSYNTTASAVHDDTLLQSSKAYYRFLGASIINHAAITGDAVNNSRCRFMRSVAGVKSTIDLSNIVLDETSQAAETERYCAADQADADCLIAPGEALVSSIDARAGTGSSALPKMQIRVAAIKYFKT